MASQKVYLTTNDLVGTKQKLHLVTYFKRPMDHDRVKNEDVIAQMFVLCQNISYSAQLKRKNINKQLAWNSDLLNRIQCIFSGHSPNHLITSIEQGLYGNKIFVVGTEFQMRSIRVTIFQVELRLINDPPFKLMKFLMNKLYAQKKQLIENLQQRQRKQKHKIEELDSLLAQIKQNHNDQIHFYKQKFLPIVNDAKRKLIKCFGSNYPNNPQLQEIGSSRSQRQILKLKNNSENKPKQQMMDEVEQLFN